MFRNSIHGSAVCAFSMNSVLDAFQGPFKYQKSFNHIWESAYDKKEVFECGPSNYSENYSNLRLNSMYQLMDNAVQSINERPYVISKNDHFKFISVDVIKTQYSHSVEILFIATRDGKLLKYVQWPNLSESCLIDQIQLIDPSEDNILSMKYSKDSYRLYFGTEKQVISVSAFRCHIYDSKEKCISSGDPYCGWNKETSECTKAPFKNYKSENWIQSKLLQCTVHQWSKWSSCKLFEKKSDESCKCRRRSCSPDSGNCMDGFEIEVANCTQHGNWSEWSPWSACLPSCGKGLQYRTRTCSNPVPMFNGLPCQGINREVCIHC